MRLSIVTPSLNQVALLRQCVACVEQLGDVEHVVSDGASTDGTAAFLAERGNLKHRSARDGGMYEAVNAGMALTTGDVLGYLNCDDLLLPWTARRVLAIFEAEPAIDVVIGDSMQLRGTRAAITVHPPTPLLRAWMRLGGVLAQPAVFFRRRVYERLGGFDTSYRFLADQDFFKRAIEAGLRMRREPEVLAIERMSEGQLTAKFREQVADERRRLYGKKVDALPRSLAWRATAASLHRLGILGLTVASSAPVGPWPLLRASGLVEPGDARGILSSLVFTSSARTYARLDARALASVTSSLAD